MDTDRQPEETLRAASTRWEFITLADFKNSSPITVFAYVWLWFMAIVAVAVYAVDTFTAINLLVFNNWSSQIQPFLAFKYSKWIFSVCIIVSWVLCFYEWFRAIRAIRRGGVADSYMDPLAVTLQSMRSGGWRRFLVFKELSKSKKRIDYVALFVYFAFKGALRIILAEGPRQVINALTLYSVMVAKLIGAGSSDDNSKFVQFFLNIKELAEQDDRQAIILFSMLFTLVIWVFSALSLMVAIILYVVFLWQHIPRNDGSLRAYCRRKIDKRLDRIVGHKVQAGIEEERRKREKAEQKAELKRQKTGELAPPAPPKIVRQPTLPQLDTFADGDMEKAMPGKLERQNTTSTVSTLPPYSIRSPQSSTLHRQPTLPDINEDSMRPTTGYRSVTQGSEWSNASYESDAPLLPNAGQVDGSMPFPPTAYSSRQGSTSSFRRPLPTRQGTMNSVSTERTYRSQTPRADPRTPAVPPLGMYTGPDQEWPGSRPPYGQRFETETSSNPNPSESAEPLPPFRMPFASQSTNTSVDLSHERADSQISYFSRPVINPGPMAYPATNMDREVSQQSIRSQSGSFSRPFGRGTPAPPSASGFNRQPTNDSVHTPQTSFSGQPPMRKPTPANANLYRPFSPAIASTPGSHVGNAGAYEMTVHPSVASTAAVQTFEAPQSNSAQYVAFNPRAATPASAAPMTAGSTSTHKPWNSNSSTTGPSSRGIGHEGSYFSAAHGDQDWYAPPSMPAASHDHRLTTGYNDILDDYGGSTPGG